MPETTPTGPEAISAIDRLSLSVSSPRGSAVAPALGGGDWSPNNPMCFEADPAAFAGTCPINPMCFEAGPAVNGPHGTPNCVCFEAE